jgi:SAM-dependent methyltransferase
MKIDFGNTAHDYKSHRQGFPPAFFERLLALGVIGANKHVLDMGTGTGALARGAALRGSHVVGVDIAAALLDQARLLDAEAGVQVTYHLAPAEQTGLPDASFHSVLAGQCWHWFDRPRAAAEVKRLLVPNGKAAIAHLDWIPLPGNVVEATEALILQYNPDWLLAGGSGIYPDWLHDLARAGFADLETFSFDVNLSYTPEAWRGRVRASAGVAASLPPAVVQQFDSDLQELLRQRFPQNPLQIQHRVWAVTARKVG